jgi:hypothetical protein
MIEDALSVDVIEIGYRRFCRACQSTTNVETTVFDLAILGVI